MALSKSNSLKGLISNKEVPQTNKAMDNKVNMTFELNGIANVAPIKLPTGAATLFKVVYVDITLPIRVVTSVNSYHV